MSILERLELIITAIASSWIIVLIVFFLVGFIGTLWRRGK